MCGRTGCGTPIGVGSGSTKTWIVFPSDSLIARECSIIRCNNPQGMVSQNSLCLTLFPRPAPFNIGEDVVFMPALLDHEGQSLILHILVESLIHQQRHWVTDFHD